MQTYLICYDLNKLAKDYSQLVQQIETLFPICWHHLESTWIVKSNLTPAEIANKLEAFIDNNDDLLVVNITGGAVAWAGFSKKMSNWLGHHL